MPRLDVGSTAGGLKTARQLPACACARAVPYVRRPRRVGARQRDPAWGGRPDYTLPHHRQGRPRGRGV